MDKENFAQRLLQLTMKIIYLLTGEDYVIMKKCSDHMTSISDLSKSQNSGAIGPPPANEQKILEVANSIIHLLTGEVLGGLEDSEDLPDKCEDLYKVVIREQPLTSPGIPESVSKLEALHVKKGRCVDGSSQSPKSTKRRRGSLLAERRAPKLKRLHAVASPQAYEPCPSSPTAALSDDDLNNVEYTLDAVREELVSLKGGDHKEVGVGASSWDLLQAYKDRPEGGTRLAAQSSFNAADLHEDLEYALVDVKEETASCVGAKVKKLKGIDQRHANKNTPESADAGRRLHGFDAEGRSGQLGNSSPPSFKNINFQCAECPRSFNLLSELLQHQASHQQPAALTCSPPGDHVPLPSSPDHRDLDYLLVQIKEEIDTMEKEDDIALPEASPEDLHPSDASEADCDDTPGQPLDYANSTEAPGQLGGSSLPIPNAKTYGCPECPNVFNCLSELVKHQTHHRGLALVTCSTCGKNFTSKSNLAKHRKIHTGEKPYSCAECGKCFRERHHLVSHQLVHSGAQLITCSVCGKGYTSKSNLAKHQRIHTGQKPFACSICGKSFNQRSVLLAHQRTHTGEKPFTCQLCQRRFTDKLQLERHLTTHSGEKPFSCSVCAKRFSRKKGLVRHLESQCVSE